MMLLAKKRLPFCRCANVKVILKEKKLTAKGIYGIPANQVNDDDIELTPQLEGESCFTLRQQAENKRSANIALSDFIAPKILERQIIWVLLCNYRFRC
jgi:cobalamin-dependent methionine synthase I